MKSFTRIFLSLLAFAAQPALAQEATPSVYLETVDTTAYPRVVVRLTAWGPDGLPLQGLAPQDFTLQEDGGAPLHPDFVAVNADSPLWVALVIDVSGSMQGQPLTDAKAAAARFLDRLESSDYAALLAFSEVDPDPLSLDPAREIGFTSDLEPIYNTVENLQAGGGTYLYQATAKAVQWFLDKPAGHRAILVLSDGRNDPPTTGDPEEPIRLAQDAGVPVFVVGLGSQIDEPYLRRLAGETGGLFRSTPRSSELANLFADMAALLKTQYEVTYTSQLPADGQEHILSLALTYAGSTVTVERSMGPLPLIEATTIPTEAPAIETPAQPEVATALPPASEPTATDKPADTIAATPTETLPPLMPLTFMDYLVSYLPIIVIAGLALVGVVVLLVVLFGRKKSRPKPEACAKCGFDMTGKTGACPQCGETRRLPKMKT